MASTSRRVFISNSLAAAAALRFGPACFAGAKGPASSVWEKNPDQPVLGGSLGTCFDVCILRQGKTLKMWFSWRPKKSIALTESQDGITWSVPTIVLSGVDASDWEEDVNRPIVVRRKDEYHMWYTGQAKGRSSIGYARSSDGLKWLRIQKQPVLTPSEKWEGVALMVPHVIWESSAHHWRMWYSGGEQYEPNAIGVATSADGMNWQKYASNPVLVSNPSQAWEKDRVTAAQVIQHNGFYYAFYIGFRDIDHAQIGLARSRDGLTNWVRHSANPIISPTPGGWDADACYKPFALQIDDDWFLWYNGRSKNVEQIGRAIQRGRTLNFSGKG
jgi:predicted GH43/DUF377 family glycosyl hydrolase